MSSIAVHPQCEGDIYSLGISTSLRAITFEVSRIAQVTKVGWILGSSLSLHKEQSYDYRYSTELKTNAYVVTGYHMVLSTSIHVYGTYKLVHKEYNYSVHLLLGGVWDEVDGPYLSGGFEIRKPINTKCLFLRGLYPGDFRAGILFQL